MGDKQQFDYLVIGSGIAGLFFALKAAKNGKVAIITKKNQSESNTNYAQGGIAAVMDVHDTFEGHIKDTLIAGDGLCNEKAVEMMVKDAPECINELISIGVDFTKENNGDLALGREGGHHANRVVHAKDLTGREIERALIAAVKKEPNISIFENHLAIDLIMEKDEKTNEDKCFGAYVFDRKEEVEKAFLAKVVLLCSGGTGRIYLHTTNPDIATGDGIAMAYRAGAKLANLEFVQFHPTTLFHPDGHSFLISEALRGFGGVLKLKNGQEFMPRYHEMGSLAPRDIVARAIETELKITGDECVYLDVTHLDAEKVKEEFPTIYNQCLSLGIDITKQMIPVVPAAHYMCGGVMTDLNAQTTIQGLYACGETACTGVHGANRLASNSLLEALVFAKRAVLDSAKNLDAIKIPKDDIYDQPHGTRGNGLTVSYEKERLIIQKAMSGYVGISRNNAGLAKAMTIIEELIDKIETLYFYSPLDANLIELRNMATVAYLVISAAAARKESRGLHYNTDFPNKITLTSA
ncbi:MAG: L-aspartate oxidase [Bacteroidota bacterium]